MKKTYINPSMVVVHLGVIRHLATSDPDVGINGEGSVDAASVETRQTFSNSNVWDDEW